MDDENNQLKCEQKKDCRKCKKEVCECNKTTCTYAYKQYGMKRWVYGIIITVILVGLIVPFFSEVICTMIFPNAVVGLNTWNQFVGIILGIVATILSIVSLIMGFKNYEDSLELHEKHVETLEKLGKISKDIEGLDGRITIMTDSKSENSRIPPKKQWIPEPESEKDVNVTAKEI